MVQCILQLSKLRLQSPSVCPLLVCASEGAGLGMKPHLQTCSAGARTGNPVWPRGSCRKESQGLEGGGVSVLGLL